MTTSIMETAAGQPAPMDRIPTGVKGLDELMQGGVPNPSTILVAGKAGSMKTTLCFQMMFKAVQAGYGKGLYISLEQPVESLSRHLINLGYSPDDIRKLAILDLGNLKADESSNPESMDWFEAIVSAIRVNIERLGVRIVTIDSLNALYAFMSTKDPRSILFRFLNRLQALRVTVLLVTEMTGEHFGIFGVESFLADGIIHLDLRRDGNTVGRWISVQKMRATKHEMNYYPVIVDKTAWRIVVR